MNFKWPLPVVASLRALLVLLLLVAPPALAHEGEDDCGTGEDAPFSVFRGAIVGAPIDCLAHLGGAADERDSYRFAAPPGVTLRVEVVPLTPGHFPNLGLFTPDHDESGGSRLVDRNTANETFVEVDSVEPGLWGVYVYLMASNTSGAIAHGDYRLVITLEGAPWTPDPFEGSFLVGAPVGSRLDRALGPDAGELDGAPEDPRGPRSRGLDGKWVELAKTTTGADFVQVRSDSCEECLFVSYRVASGSVLDASCQRHEDTVSCLPFAGVTHILVHAAEGTEISFTGLHWHAPA